MADIEKTIANSTIKELATAISDAINIGGKKPDDNTLFESEKTFSEYKISNYTKKIKLLNDEINEINKQLSEISNKDSLEYQKLEYRLRNINEERKKLIKENGAISNITKINKGLSEIYGHVKSLNDPWAKADHAASKFTKTIGMAKAGMEALRKQSLENIGWGGFGHKYNISTEELIQAQSNYIKGIGRNIIMSNNAQESMAAIRAVAGDGGLNFAAQLENFGISMEGAGNHIYEMFTNASKQGLSFEKYSENVSKNIKIAQNYTFRDGLKGLENMAKKATAIKLDMQQVANFADKVSTVEGSIETAAKLQVLGGPFSIMADPMGMLNESLNDMEAFQDRIAKIYGRMGHFDTKTGQVNVSAFDKQRLKAYAEATGQDYSSVMETVHTSAKREEILKQLRISGNTNLDNDMKELIANAATFKDGKAGVSIKGEFITLDKIGSEHRKELEKLTQDQSKDIKDIAMNLRSLVDMREGVTKSAEGLIGSTMSIFGRLEKSILGLGSVIAPIIGAKMIINHGVGTVGGGKDIYEGIKGLFGGTKGGTKNGTSGSFIKNMFKKGGGFISKALPAISMGTLGSAALIGGAVATVAGAGIYAYNKVKKRRQEALDNRLENLGIKRNSNYSARKLKLINKALTTGEISEKMRRKLINRGEVDILNEIDKAKGKYGVNDNISAFDKIKNKAIIKSSINIQNAIIEVKNANFTQTPSIKVKNESGVTNINGKPYNGQGSNYVKVNEKKTVINNEVNNGKITLDINLNGNLKLVGEKGQTIDMVDYYRKNPQQLRGVAEMLEKAIIENYKGSIFNKNNQKANQ